MSKKTIGYIITGFVVIAVSVLFYLLATKGYLGRGIGPVTVSQTPASATSSGAATGETGNITSDKISLMVTSPEDGSILDSTSVVVKGKTVPGADVFVNDQSGKADANGNFSIAVELDEGDNQIVVSVNDTEGNAAEQSLKVTVASFE